jgi:hypothetical protein
METNNQHKLEKWQLHTQFWISIIAGVALTILAIVNLVRLIKEY